MKEHRIEPGSTVRLNELDANDTTACGGGKKAGAARLVELNEQLAALQEVLFAENKHRMLVILQGMDTSGKDSTVTHVFAGVNPVGIRMASFKKPGDEELRHDFLWRVHPKVPGNGELGIFNRSHYEDVLVVRVHKLVPPAIWQSRYQQINDFERLLAESGTTILKFYLHIDRDEQRKQLRERLKDPTKRWKFNHGDLDERKLWDEYMIAYQDAIEKTSTAWAPWYVVPANAKWCRHVIVADIVVKRLKKLKMKYPTPKIDLNDLKIE